ncbi:toll/interleukin-1 receptor domain-containing protein [Ideonella sp. DXS22W]|uniref:Toll/interleukin-1 receptor domain-containing protein n=1 Tax=Pseudaquabacterium inlustre TaxID=2984192 RepID=A0ABU9CLR0_9BURK
MKLFISYRRADTQAVALLVERYFSDTPGVESVFLDVEDIDAAQRFGQRIRDALAQASHVIVLMGRQWRGPRTAPEPARITQADDMVRLEVAQALRSGATVVPLLVDGAAMPRPADLPEDLRGLTERSAFDLRTARFQDDMDALLRQLTGRTTRALSVPLSPGAIARRAAAGSLVGAALLLATAVAYLLWDGRPCDGLACALQQAFGLGSEADGLGLLAVLAGAVLLLSALAPVLAHGRR